MERIFVKREVKRYTIQLLGLMATYAVLLVLSIWLLEKIPTSGWRLPIAALPVVPLLFVVWSIIHFIRTMDEMQKTIHLEALTFSFLVTVVVALTYGFLENAGLPKIPLFYVPVLMCGLWGIGAGVFTRKYK
jgi:hypothetical protein